MVDFPGPACSDWARSQGLQPVGTAGYYQGFLLVEQPLPWPHDIGELPELIEASALVAPSGVRLQAVYGSLYPGAPDGGAGLGEVRRVVYYWSPAPGWSAPLVRSEVLCRPSEVGQAVAELLRGATGVAGAISGASTAPGTGAGAGASAEVGAPAGTDPRADPDVIDVLVCTHGRRDTCCGSYGTELFGSLVKDGFDVGPGHPEIRLWRTSHTGGHRFAPTAFVLPWATFWAWASPDLLAQVAINHGPCSGVLDHYRGCATVGPPPHQALEKALLAQVGWDLVSTPRRTIDRPDHRVRLESRRFGTWDAVVREGRRVPQPDCHASPELTSKTGVEWVVEDLRRVPVREAS